MIQDSRYVPNFSMDRLTQSSYRSEKNENKVELIATVLLDDVEYQVTIHHNLKNKTADEIGQIVHSQLAVLFDQNNVVGIDEIVEKKFKGDFSSYETAINPNVQKLGIDPPKTYSKFEAWAPGSEMAGKRQKEIVQNIFKLIYLPKRSDGLPSSKTDGASFNSASTTDKYSPAISLTLQRSPERVSKSPVSAATVSPQSIRSTTPTPSQRAETSDTQVKELREKITSLELHLASLKLHGNEGIEQRLEATNKQLNEIKRLLDEHIKNTSLRTSAAIPTEVIDLRAALQASQALSEKTRLIIEELNSRVLTIPSGAPLENLGPMNERMDQLHVQIQAIIEQLQKPAGNERMPSAVSDKAMEDLRAAMQESHQISDRTQTMIHQLNTQLTDLRGQIQRPSVDSASQNSQIEGLHQHLNAVLKRLESSPTAETLAAGNERTLKELSRLQADLERSKVSIEGLGSRFERTSSTASVDLRPLNERMDLMHVQIQSILESLRHPPVLSRTSDREEMSRLFEQLESLKMHTNAASLQNQELKQALAAVQADREAIKETITRANQAREDQLQREIQNLRGQLADLERRAPQVIERQVIHEVPVIEYRDRETVRVEYRDREVIREVEVPVIKEVVREPEPQIFASAAAPAKEPFSTLLEPEPPLIIPAAEPVMTKKVGVKEEDFGIRRKAFLAQVAFLRRKILNDLAVTKEESEKLRRVTTAFYSDFVVKKSNSRTSDPISVINNIVVKYTPKDGKKEEWLLKLDAAEDFAKRFA